jgi:hypothetical protein
VVEEAQHGAHQQAPHRPGQYHQLVELPGCSISASGTSSSGAAMVSMGTESQPQPASVCSRPIRKPFTITLSSAQDADQQRVDEAIGVGGMRAFLACVGGLHRPAAFAPQ